MVLVGNYSVRLLNAETNEAFKEHNGPGGKFYAEIEPDLEYFIEVEVIGGYDPNQLFIFEFTVDGKKLSYCTPLAQAYGKYKAGIWSYENGVTTTRAFSLQRPKFTDKKNSISGGLMGSVKVDVSEAIYAGKCTRSNFSGDSIDPAAVTSSLSHPQTKKVLRSGEGSHAETKHGSAAIVDRYLPGELLESITLNYCTALGLIHAGVLKRPSDFWEEARMLYPAKRSNADKENATIVQPKRVKKEGGGSIAPPTEHDLFDLSAVNQEGDSDAE